MSIFGALYSSVSGIQAQGTAIGIISDNISNVNTVGYKAGSSYFSTLVTTAAGASTYSEGGVRAQDRALVDKQGTIQSTSSPLDTAINGNGMFVVASSANAANNPSISYTRAGSFRADSVGNFVNASGLYLKAWPLDSNGNIPVDSSSLNSLQVVNIGSATGAASETTNVDVGVRLNSSSPILTGSGATGTPGADLVNTENKGVVGTGILVPNANLEAGDSLKTTVNGTLSYDYQYGGFATSSDITSSSMFGSSTGTGTFSSGITDGDTFTITNSSDPSNPLTFTYAESPTTSSGQFNSLSTLADAINQATGLTSRVATVGGKTQLFVSSTDARNGLTFTNGAGNHAGDDNIVTTLGISDVAATSDNRFNSLDGLASLINTQTSGNISASVVTGATASIKINNDNPLTSIKFANDDAMGGTSNFLAELGFPSATVAPAYDASASSTKSMASGAITPTYQKQVDIYDSLGAAHTVTIGFAKTGTNTWQAEIYTAKGGADETDGINQLATGKFSFNTDGSLASIDSSLTTNIQPITWADGATTSGLSFDLGSAGPIGVGTKTGLSEASGTESVSVLSANGNQAGLLDTVTIDDQGYITANFTNGQTQKLYKIPIATFSDTDGLIAQNGNSYIQSNASGQVNLVSSGTGSAGSIEASSLEGSNTELSDELTDMIVAQRAYQASTKVITTASELLDDLNRIGGS